MNDGDYVITGTIYAISAFALWLGTRRSTERFVRWQWRKPLWILVRLLVLVLALHAVFALSGFGSAVGYPFLGLIAVLMLVEPTGLFGIVACGVGRAAYEWIFWMPSRRKLILRNRKASARANKKDFIGTEATVISDLRPVGTIAVNGIHHPARSDFGFIARGQRVVIQAIGDFEVRVRPAESTLPGNRGA